MRSTSPRSHGSVGAGDIRAPPASRARSRSRRSSSSCGASSPMPPRALEPSGLFLVDKPAGPSSFQVVAAVRRRTGARTGHAGTLDPFATGLLLVLSGAATRLAPWLVGLDKRYVTEVDLSARTSTGDPEGGVVEERVPPDPSELEVRLDGLRGEVELVVPTASAVKVGGERAYRLHRRGQTVAMAVRRLTVASLVLQEMATG